MRIKKFFISIVTLTLSVKTLSLQAGVIHDLVKSGDLNRLKHYLSRPENQRNVNNQTFIHGNTPLIKAAQIQRADIAAFLIYKGARQDIRNRAGKIFTDLIPTGRRQHFIGQTQDHYNLLIQQYVQPGQSTVRPTFNPTPPCPTRKGYHQPHPTTPYQTSRPEGVQQSQRICRDPVPFPFNPWAINPVFHAELLRLYREGNTALYETKVREYEWHSQRMTYTP